MAQVPKGAWKSQEPTGSTSTLIVADNYLCIASYSVNNKYFERAEGGPFVMSGDKMTYTPEFNSADTAALLTPIINYAQGERSGIPTHKPDTKYASKNYLDRKVAEHAFFGQRFR